MPSANITPAAVKTASTISVNGDILDYVNQPMKPALTIVEHKIRNLEKRKGKLDQYKSEQDAGKELNADQLAAVAKYGEVIQQLELARDLMKQIGQANEDTRKEIKKHRKAEATERAVQETEKLRNLFLFQLVINELENTDVSKENENGDLKNAVLVIKKHQFVRYSELLKICDPNVQSIVDMLASNWIQVLDGSKKLVDSQSKDRTTFKNIRDDLLAVVNSDYFVNRRNNEPVEEEPVDSGDTNVSDSESIPSSAINTNTNSIPQELHRIEPSVIIPGYVAHHQQILNSVCHVQDSTYQFLQDSQLDLGSPHFDPAVVAVSSSLPHGPINQFDHHQVRNAGNAYTITTPAPQHISAPQQQHTSAPQQQRISAPQQQHISVPQQQQHIPMSNGIGNRVEVGYNQQPIMPLIDDKINEWNASDAHQHLNGNYQQDDRSGSDDNEGGNYNNRFSSNNRGRGGGTGRGFRRGSLNNFAPRGGNNNVRGGRPSTAFSGQGNNRMGYFRPDQPGQQLDHSFESREFLSSSRNGAAASSGFGSRNIREPGSGIFGNNNNASRISRETVGINFGSGNNNSRISRETGSGNFGSGNNVNRHARGEPGPVGNGLIGQGRNTRFDSGVGGFGSEQRQRGGGGNVGGYRGGIVSRGGSNKPATPRTSENNGLMTKCY